MKEKLKENHPLGNLRVNSSSPGKINYFQPFNVSRWSDTYSWMKIMHNTGTWKAYQMSIKEKLPIKFTHNQANSLLSLRYEASRVDLKKIFILKSRSNFLQNQTMRNLGASQEAYVEQELPSKLANLKSYLTFDCYSHPFVNYPRSDKEYSSLTRGIEEQ